MSDLELVDDWDQDDDTDDVDAYRGKPPPGEWADRSLCASHPNPELWFPERGASVAEAKAVCRVCPVQSECLDHAIRCGEKHGIWGGRSERERRRIRRAARTTRRGTAA